MGHGSSLWRWDGAMILRRSGGVKDSFAAWGDMEEISGTGLLTILLRALFLNYCKVTEILPIREKRHEVVNIFS
jgi:hypothetical protein